MVRLLTVIGHGVNLLPHFIKHYKRYVDEINIAIYKTDLYPTLEEDIKGIDGKFIFKGVERTIQVKPYENFIIEDGIGNATSNGSLTLNTDVLILYKEDPLKKDVFGYIIANKNNVKIVGNNFILTKWEAKGEKIK
jgi:hypothetical protein